MLAAEENGYSARVKIHMRANGRQLSVSQVGRNFAILRDACCIPPSTQAEIVINVDGDEDIHSVYLPHGADNSRYIDFF